MRVLVTGAQGCIGAWVVKTLVERGVDVVAFDLLPDPVRLCLIAPPEVIRKVRFESGLIEDGARIKALVREGGITHIVHLAAVLMPFCQKNPVQGARVNVIGTLNVFEAARDAGRPVRVTYASSAAVWGPVAEYGGKILTEDDPITPNPTERTRKPINGTPKSALNMTPATSKSKAAPAQNISAPMIFSPHSVSTFQKGALGLGMAGSPGSQYQFACLRSFK